MEDNDECVLLKLNYLLILRSFIFIFDILAEFIV